MAAAATTGTATINAVTTANCMIVLQGVTGTANSNTAYSTVGVRVALTNGTTVTATRGNATSFTAVVNAVIIEFWPAYVNSIQAGTIAISANGTSNTATITSVSANAFVILQGVSDANASTTFSQGIATVSLTNSTTVTAATLAASGQAMTVGYMVVDLTSALIKSIQQKTHTDATSATSYTDTITSVTQANTFIAYGGISCVVSTTNAVASHTIVLTNATTVTMQRGTSTTSSRTINYTVVELQSGVLFSSVQRNTVVIALSAGSNTSALGTSVNTNFAFVNWLGYKVGTGSFASANSTALTLTDNVTVTSNVNATTSSSDTTSFEVLEFVPTPINFKPKPPGKLRINDDDKYGKSVMWAALPGTELRELRTGARGTIVGTVAQKMTPFGTALSVATAGGNGVKFTNSLSYMKNRVGTTFSIVAIGQVTAGSAPKGKFFSCPANDSVWTDPFDDLNMAVSAVPGTSASAAQMDWATGTTAGSLEFAFNNSGICSPTDYHVWVVTWDGSLQRSYQDGVLLGTWTMINSGVTATKPTFALDIAYLFLASPSQLTESIAGVIGGLYVVDGALNAYDAQVLAANPWRPFIDSSAYFPERLEFLSDPVTSSSSVSVNLTAVTATSSVASVTPTVLPTVTGVSATSSVHSVTPTVLPTFTGVSATSSVASVTPTIFPTFTGVSATSSVHSVTVQASSNISLTGVSATSSVGSVTPTVKPTISGVSATSSVGSVTIQISSNITLSGVSATSSVGSVTPTVKPTVTGVSATSSVGSVAITIFPTLSGVSATSSVGSVTPTVFPTVSGVSATSSVGSLGVKNSPTITGVVGTSSVGSVAITVFPTISGVSATSSVGSLTPTVKPTFTGVTATTTVGSVAITIFPTVTGVTATGSVGSLTIFVGTTVILSGVSATSSVGSLDFSISTNVVLTGVTATGSVNSVRVDKTVTLPGLPATGGIGNLVIVYDQIASLPGIPVGDTGIGIPMLIQSRPPTSGTFLFDLTYADIILQAYAMAGFFSESLATHDMLGGLNQINLILSDWMNQITMATMTDLQVVPLLIGQQSFQCPVGTDDILVLVVHRNGYDLAMERISVGQYTEITNKGAQGLPSQYYVQRTPYNVTVWLWQTSNVSTDVIRYYRKVNLQDAVAFNNITGLRPNWVFALICNLAAYVAAMRKAPPAIAQVLTKKSDTAFANACSGECEDARLMVEAWTG